MSLFDFFKKKKPEKKIKKEVKKKPEKKVEKKPVSVKVEKKEEKIKPEEFEPKKKVLGKSYQVLYSPHVTEKATDFAEKNKYVFKIWPRVNKVEVKEAVENTYGVDVIGVKMINVPRKKRRLGARTGWRKGYKKAIVKIKKGQKIEILPR